MKWTIAYVVVVLAVGGVLALQQGSTLSAVAARYVDNTLPHKKMPFDERMWQGFKARCVSVLVYPVYAAADTVYLTAKASVEYAQSISHKDPLSANYYHNAVDDFTLARRSLVGLLTSPTGIISGDYVTRHFVDERRIEGLIVSGGKYYSAPGYLYSPVDVDQVVSLVQYARDNDRNVSIIGSQLSQGMQFLPNDSDDLVLSLRELNSVTVDPEAKTAVVQAGATWRDVQKAINPHGLAIQVMQASNIFTLGGSLSANCHGWDHRAGSISETVRRMTIVDAEGNLRTLTPSDPEFGLVIGGWGLFGVIVDAELELTDNSPLIDRGEPVPIEKYVEHFYQNILPEDAIEMHLYRLSLDPDALLSEGIAQNYWRDPQREARLVSNLHDESEKGRRIERVGVHSARKFAAVRKKYWEMERERIQRPVATTRNDEMRAPIQAMFTHSYHDAEWLQEFFLPGDRLGVFVKQLGELLTEYEVVLLNASVRYVKASPEVKMGYSQAGDRFAVVLAFNQPLDEREVDHTKEWIRKAIDLTLDNGGSYYLPYQHFASKKQFLKSYPQFDRFVAAKKRYDPKGVFSSQFYDLHLSYLSQQGSGKTVEPAQINDAYDAFKFVFSKEDLRREFRKFLRNIFLNLEEDAFVRLVDKHLQDASSHEELYTALEADLSEAQFGKVVDVYRSFKALFSQRAVLKDQVERLMQTEEKIDGYVEIGFPGRMVRPLKRTLGISGKTYVVNTEEAFSDYVQCGFPRSYDLFVPLNDYQPLTQEMDRESVDLVAMFIGLHHCPVNKLEAFAESIAQILRPGGSFILRDHDVVTAEDKAQAILAHSTFNLGMGVQWDTVQEEWNDWDDVRGLQSLDYTGGFDEKHEIRNFQSLEYWDTLLERFGLVRDKQVGALIRIGDPTRNSLVRYVKQLAPAAQERIAAEQELKWPDSERKQLQTFMTSIEWYSVRSAEDYAGFVQHTPFYMYPYFQYIRSFWKLYGQSWDEARRYSSRWDILSSDYFLMNTFIACFHTVEFATKGLISAPIAWMYQSESNLEPDTIQVVVSDPNGNLDRYMSEGVTVLDRASSRPSMKRIEMPRYLVFRDLVVEMAGSDIRFVNIAGQKRVQVQCTVRKGDEAALEELPGSRLIGTIPVPINPQQTIAYLNVEVAALHKVLNALSSQGIQIDYIHDF